MNVSVWRLLAVALAVSLIGCGPRGDSPPVDPNTALRQEQADDAPESGNGPSAAERPVSVRVIDEEEFAEVLAGYRGEVVLVDFWATWCLACVELFPHTVALHERFADDGLRVISVSFDQPESKAAVLEFLKARGATFDNFISRYGAGIESPQRFGLPGTLPQLRLYGRDGELAYTFPEPQSAVDPEAVDEAVKRLLEDGS